MTKKMWLAALAAFGLSMTVGAADLVRMTFNLYDDDDATIKIVSKGANVRPGKLSKFPKPHKGRTLPVFCTLDENGEAELELTIEVSGDGRFNIGCGAFGNPDPKTKKRPVTWVDCTALTVNDKTEIPGAKIKVIPVARWRLVSRTWKQTDTKTYVIKASFEKVSADRAAKLSAQAKRNAAKSRKK